jgi:glycosyltransferase involved in cell wall biosynthesis
MRVAFLVEELGRSGGMAVVRRHARHLAEHAAADVELVVCDPKAPLGPEDVPVRRLADVRREVYDVAVATWWTTAEALFELRAARRVAFLQNLEMRFYGEEEFADRLGAFGVLDLPVDYVVIASHMRDLLADLRPDARVRLVPNGIDKAVFRAAEPRDGGGPVRVLVEGQPTLWFKAVQQSIAAVRRMREPATVTAAVHDPADAGELGADRIVGGLSPSEMAALYAEHDVLLKLSRFEGFGLPTLEAFHCGVPCVVTPFTGSEDAIEHGANALVVGFDDEAGTTAALDRLATDAALRARLREGALATAARWPDVEQSGAAFAEAVQSLLAEPPPPPDAALRRMAHGRRLATELGREAGRWRSDYAAVRAENADYEAWTRELRRRIEEMQARPGFRVEERIKRFRGRPG